MSDKGLVAAREAASCWSSTDTYLLLLQWNLQQVILPLYQLICSTFLLCLHFQRDKTQNLPCSRRQATHPYHLPVTLISESSSFSEGITNSSSDFLFQRCQLHLATHLCCPGRALPAPAQPMDTSNLPQLTCGNPSPNTSARVGQEDPHRSLLCHLWAGLDSLWVETRLCR